MSSKRMTLTLAVLLAAAAVRAEVLMETVTIADVGKTTRAEVTGRFAALVDNEQVVLGARLAVDGSDKGSVACDYKATSTKGEYTFKVPVDFSKYVDGDARVDALLSLTSNRNGQFKDVKVSILSPRDPAGATR